MLIKSAIKSLVGEQRAHDLRATAQYLATIRAHNSQKSRLQVLGCSESSVRLIQQRDSHVFCGYYDIAPDNPFRSNEILVHLLNRRTRNAEEEISLCVADIKNGEIKPLESSKAWCWQMGSRLRWGTIKEGFYYNDCDSASKEYCCKWFDRNLGTSIVAAPKALYDISKDETFGISTDFSRLGRLRPGYGYCNYPDVTRGVLAPSDIGLERVSLIDGSSSVLVSLAELSSTLQESHGGETYINHIAISPSGKKVMFFFIWTTAQSPGWKATLWVYDFELGIAKCLEKTDQVSHYCWVDDQKLIVTGVTAEERKGFYRVYDSNSGDYEAIDSESLARDGHPTISRLRNGFYSDTYPDGNYMQSFFFYNMESGCTPIAKLFHDPRMYGERRCDLHPHYFRSSETFALDTTCMEGKRSVVLIGIGDVHES